MDESCPSSPTRHKSATIIHAMEVDPCESRGCGVGAAIGDGVPAGGGVTVRLIGG
jgi:hypothetical protein